MTMESTSDRRPLESKGSASNDTSEPAIGGLTLEHLAAVEAALAEGFELSAVLSIEGLDPSQWSAAEPAWKSRLVSSEMPGGVDGDRLFAAYKCRLAEAEDRLGRRVEPLDHDLGAWTSFLKAWSAHPSPFDLLTKLGLRMNDVSRLSRRWAARIEAEPSLQSRAADLAQRAEPEIAPLRLEPAKLRPSPYARAQEPTSSPASPPADVLEDVADTFGYTSPAVEILRAPTLPFGPPDPDASLHPPPPPPVRRPPALRPPSQLTGTSPYVEIRRTPVLPFEGAEPPPLLTASGDINETSPFVAIVTSPVLPFDPSPSEPRGAEAPPPGLTLEQHASLTLELILYPTRSDDVLQRYRISRPALDRLNADYKRRFAADPTLHKRWHNAYQTYYAWLASAVISK